MLPAPDHASPTPASPSPRMHKCVVLTYASGLARFFRVQVCTCVHAYLHVYICIPIYLAIECSQVFPCHCAFPSCLPPTCLLHCVSVMVQANKIGSWKGGERSWPEWPYTAESSGKGGGKQCPKGEAGGQEGQSSWHWGEGTKGKGMWPSESPWGEDTKGGKGLCPSPMALPPPYQFPVAPPMLLQPTDVRQDTCIAYHVGWNDGHVAGYQDGLQEGRNRKQPGSSLDDDESSARSKYRKKTWATFNDMYHPAIESNEDMFGAKLDQKYEYYPAEI